MTREIKIFIFLFCNMIYLSCGRFSNSFEHKLYEKYEKGKIGTVADAINSIENRKEIEGIKILNYLIKNTKDSLSYLSYIKSRAFYRLKDFSSSMLSINKSIINDTSNYRSYAVKGDIFQQLNKFDSSSFYYSIANNGIPNDKYILNNLGTLYVKTSQFDSAKIIFEKLYFVDSLSVDFLFNLSFTYYKQAAFEKALSIIDKAILLNIQDEGLYNLKGQILGKQGKFNDAVKSFEKSIVLKPNHNVAVENLKRLKNGSS